MAKVPEPGSRPRLRHFSDQRRPWGCVGTLAPGAPWWLKCQSLGPGPGRRHFRPWVPTQESGAARPYMPRLQYLLCSPTPCPLNSPCSPDPRVGSGSRWQALCVVLGFVLISRNLYLRLGSWLVHTCIPRQLPGGDSFDPHLGPVISGLWFACCCKRLDKW